MSNRVSKIKKNSSSSYFYSSMYRTFPGSVLICYCMFERPNGETKLKIKQLWKKVEKNPEKYFTEETVFDINAVLSVFGLERTYDWPVAVFGNKVNTLLAPYIVNPENKEEISALPLRENGMMPDVLSKPDLCFIVDWNK